ncbi:Uncharacterised protein [Bordetella pertussis]|nr:Uncharacterised protein [Bordetella pertussis]
MRSRCRPRVSISHSGSRIFAPRWLRSYISVSSASNRPAGPTEPMVCWRSRRLMSGASLNCTAVTCWMVSSTDTGCSTKIWISAMNRLGKIIVCGEPSIMIWRARSAP